MSRPVVAVTMGDAAGIGPEIIVKALARQQVYDGARPVVVGDAARLGRAVELTGVRLGVTAVDGPADARYQRGVVDVIDLDCIPADLPFGKLSAAAGEGAYRFVETAVDLAMRGDVDAICTAPLNKEALHAAGHVFPGHTELLAELTGTDEVSMLLNAPRLRVIHVTTHVGLVDMVSRINPGLVERTIRRGHDTLVTAGIERPRIAVCGINPHAGENGLFGNEDEHEIRPAAAALQAEGIDAYGPIPGDTVFLRALKGEFDAVVAMYHDQGHIPSKLAGFDDTVNITLGLPIIRTSVDHGTAFDIAGTGKAQAVNMEVAIDLAAGMGRARRAARST
jgi:4-hydroxythreonine-4-phosphate dehydrogenase